MKTLKHSTIFAVSIAMLLLSLVSLYAEIKLEPNQINQSQKDTTTISKNPKADKQRFNSVKGVVVKTKEAQSTLIENRSNSPEKEETEKNNGDSGKNKMETYTLLLTISTFGLFIVTFLLWRTTAHLKKIASQEFYTTHRPKIIVHFCENSTDEERKIGTICTYGNIGATDAVLLSVNANISYAESLRPGEEMHSIADNGGNIKPGEKKTFFVASDITTHSAVIEGIKKGKGQDSLEIFCIGQICYSGKNGRKHETGFCRKLDSAASCWLKAENSDYEYNY